MHRGHCLCGAVTVAVEGPLTPIWACHCEMCRRWGGGLTLGTDVPEGRVTLEGPVRTFRSSEFAERAWCDTCGSHLFVRDVGSAANGLVELSPGLFRDGGSARLGRVVYADQAVGGLEFAGDIQRVSKAEYEKNNPFRDDAEPTE